MIAVNTNLYAMYAQNYSRLNNLEYAEKVERLSNGLKINYGADDPSGLAISSGMNAQMHGINTAIGNAQETIHMLQLVDHFVADQWNVLYHMRNKALELGNIAVINCRPDAPAAIGVLSSDCSTLVREIEMMKDHIYRSFVRDAVPESFRTARFNFNGKEIFCVDESGRGFEFGLPAQIGPNNDPNHRVDVIIDNLQDEYAGYTTPYTPPPPASDADYKFYYEYANGILDEIDSQMEIMTKVRVECGTQIIRFEHTIDDLVAEYNNTAASKSLIMDADMADEITAFTKNMIKQESTTMISTQANAQPLIVVKLLSAIYDGLGEKMVGATQVAPVEPVA